MLGKSSSVRLSMQPESAPVSALQKDRRGISTWFESLTCRESTVDAQSTAKRWRDYTMVPAMAHT
jgi:hypothetical protein